MPIIPPDKEFLKAQIDAVREAIGRNVYFYTTVSGDCSICAPSGLFDPLNNNSYYVTCPECQGAYWVKTLVSNEILARVHWVSDEAITATPGGKYFLGEATVTIDTKYLGIAEQTQAESQKVVVDNHDMQITKIIPMGAPGLNRYRVILKNMGDRPY